MLPVESTTQAGDGRRHSRTIVVPWPTATGAALIAAFLIGVRMSGSTVVAVGFFVPLAIFMVLDFGMGAIGIRQRPVSIDVVRRNAESPKERLSYQATAPSEGLPLRVLVRRFSPPGEDADFVVLQPNETSAQLELDSPNARSGNHVRYRVSVTHLGLVWARRWEAQETAATYIAPGPTDGLEAIPLVSEELSRIREYVPGDRMSRVSWTATARTGQLHVRAETLGDDEITVVLNLGADFNNAEAATTGLANCASVVTELLSQGRVVRLVTMSLVPKLFLDELEAALDKPHLTPRAALKVYANSAAELDGKPATYLLSETGPDRRALNERLAYAEHHPAMPMPSGPYLLVTPRGVTHVG